MARILLVYATIALAEASQRAVPEVPRTRIEVDRQGKRASHQDSIVLDLTLP